MAEYIEREALLAWFGGYKSNDPHEYISAQHIIDDIAGFPAADVAPVVHGRWVQEEFWKRVNKHSILYKTNRCSICNCDVSNRLMYNYCPNCGARMDGDRT